MRMMRTKTMMIIVMVMATHPQAIVKIQHDIKMMKKHSLLKYTFNHPILEKLAELRASFTHICIFHFPALAFCTKSNPLILLVRVTSTL